MSFEQEFYVAVIHCVSLSVVSLLFIFTFCLLVNSSCMEYFVLTCTFLVHTNRYLLPHICASSFLCLPFAAAAVAAAAAAAAVLLPLLLLLLYMSCISGTCPCVVFCCNRML